MVADAAYFLAERRGFAGGDPLADWLQAEAELDARMHKTDSDHLFGHLEEQLAAVDKKLKAVRKKVAGVTAEGRREWQRDIEKLAKLRDTFHKRLEECRRKGVNAGEKARQQAEKIGTEISEVLRRIERKSKGTGR